MLLIPDTVAPQDGHDDLLRFFIHAEVPLAPCPALRLAVHLHFPLALAEDFQARRIHKQVDLLAFQRRKAKRDFQFLRAMAKGREVRNRPVLKAVEPQEAAQKSL